MKFRNHRGGLDEAMATVQEIEPTREAICKVFNKDLAWAGLTVQPEQVAVTWYCFDERIQWNTWIVVIEGFGVFGFTNGPLENAASLDPGD